MINYLPGRLKYINGDCTIPDVGGHRFIIHVCNVDGGWGAGFVLSLSKRWKKPEEEYRKWFRSQQNFKFGEVQEVLVQSDTSVYNLLAMSYKELDSKNKIPLRYDALEICLNKVAMEAKKISGTSIHCPRLGSGLGKAEWSEIEKLIIKCLINKGINVTIYDLINDKNP